MFAPLRSTAASLALLALCAGSSPAQTSCDPACDTTPAWGLDRIDQPSPVLDGQFCVSGMQGAPLGSGEGPVLYVVGPGVNVTHEQFALEGGGSRAEIVADVTSSKDGDICDGMGTFAASIAAGATRGVARKALVRSIVAEECFFSNSWAHDALLWVERYGVKPSVVLLTNTSGTSTGLTAPIQRLSNLGVTVVAPVGDHLHWDDCTSPWYGNLPPETILVGALGPDDCPEYVAATCPDVDIWAPAGWTVGAGPGSDTMTLLKNTPVAAAALVAGVAMNHISDGLATSPAAVADLLRMTSVPSACDPALRVLQSETGLCDCGLSLYGDYFPANTVRLVSQTDPKVGVGGYVNLYSTLFGSSYGLMYLSLGEAGFSYQGNMVLIDPALIFATLFDTADLQGTARFSIYLPNDPAFTGAQIYFQAAMPNSQSPGGGFKLSPGARLEICP
jgi:hypothetical protein